MNGVRGEVSVQVDGQTHTLCLTLGALAELETAFGCGSIEDLQTRLKHLTAQELTIVLDILLRAGGSVCDAASIAPGAAARAVAEAFRAALA